MQNTASSISLSAATLLNFDPQNGTIELNVAGTSMFLEEQNSRGSSKTPHLYAEHNIAGYQVPSGELACQKYLEGHVKWKMVSQNILGLPKQILMAPQYFFLFHALICLINQLIFSHSCFSHQLERIKRK